MRTSLNFLAAAGLGLTIVGPLLLFGGVLTHDVVVRLMTAGTVCWFAGRVLRAMTTRASGDIHREPNSV